MSKLKIIPIRAGVGHVYLVITGGGFFLVDSGTKGYEKKIVKAITSRGLDVRKLLFIFLTHTHYDHAGCAAVLKEKSGAKIIVHEAEADKLGSWFPQGSGRNQSIIQSDLIYRKTYCLNCTMSFNHVEPDIVFDNKLDLSNFGINGKIIHTPGHTSGSSSLIIENNAFVGDSLFNIMHKIYPPFANDEVALLESWKKLLDHECRMVLPGTWKAAAKRRSMIKNFKKEIRPGNKLKLIIPLLQ